MLLGNDIWQDFFDDFKRSVWRLELHPVYTMPQEEEKLERFRSGERLPDGYWSPWMSRVKAYIESGRTIGRVHVVRQPLSEYLRFEFEWYYRHHVKAGEDIRILDLTGKPNPGLPDHDFWLFDEARVVKMLYRPDGTQIRRELLESPDIESYKRYRDIALDGAVPFMEYWQG
ncbi:DUF6879 family protein [Actinomadura rudentiformis]|uniref:DUF6879 domain-containing protein n=1 Tax=Actinomadura rudentiformis TaxID=359158 RepID=A0A6H9YY47_9ACTN|nr:DUF6879 family protein [Actinomadura rudentiformis]KAB2347504.1 hypothetical protein F8566_21155 [Actinomadura rudentiformis]